MSKKLSASLVEDQHHADVIQSLIDPPINAEEGGNSKKTSRLSRSSSEGSRTIKPALPTIKPQHKLLRLLSKRFNPMSSQSKVGPVGSPALARARLNSRQEEPVDEKDKLETIQLGAESRPHYPYPNPYAGIGLPPAPAHGILTNKTLSSTPTTGSGTDFPTITHFYATPSPDFRSESRQTFGGSSKGETEDDSSLSTEDEIKELEEAAVKVKRKFLRLIPTPERIEDDDFNVDDLVKPLILPINLNGAQSMADTYLHNIKERRPTGFVPAFPTSPLDKLTPTPEDFTITSTSEIGTFVPTQSSIMSPGLAPNGTESKPYHWFERKGRPKNIAIPYTSLPNKNNHISLELQGEPFINDPIKEEHPLLQLTMSEVESSKNSPPKKSVQLCSQASIIPSPPPSAASMAGTRFGLNDTEFDFANSPVGLPLNRRINTKERSRADFRKNFYSKLSYLYALILISIGFSLPVSDAIAQGYPMAYYEVYYVFLYGVSICFFLYTYFFLIRFYTKTDSKRKASVVLMNRGRSIDNDAAKLLIKKQRVTEFESSTGSFYLRMGAIAFGIGNMIYNGLQFGEFFDSNFSPHCSEILNGLVPALNLAFTFIQTYFIFSHSKICIHKYKTLARFGLMHVVATNLCVWIITLVRQTIEEIEWYHHEIAQHIPSDMNASLVSNKKIMDLSSARLHCQKNKKDIIMSKIVENAGPFLYPCTIEYSLICAAISYVMWKNIGEVPRFRKSRRARNSYTVNCENASRGLFFGIFVIVFSIISLILFFVLIEKKEYFLFAVFLNQITEIVVYMLALSGIVLAFYKMRPLKYLELRDREKLDSQLLSIAVAGEYLFSTFSIVSAVSFTSYKSVLLLTNSVINIVQSTAQTVFIIDALNRFCVTEKTEDAKPGRQLVTFLILCNFALWAFNTFANERTRTNPIQIEFYGYITWNIITHICTPLSIFYRYHSTACLAEVWKQGYKTHIDESV